MHTLNTHEVICIQTSKSSHPVNGYPSLCKSHWQKGNTELGFSAISVYSMAIPYYNKTRAACSTVFIVVRNACSKVHAYTEAEITSHVPQAPSSFPSFAVHTASDGKLGRNLGTSTQCESESFLPMAMINLRANFLKQVHAFHMLLLALSSGSLLKNGGRREPGNIWGKSCPFPPPCSGGTNQIAEQNHVYM